MAGAAQPAARREGWAAPTAAMVRRAAAESAEAEDREVAAAIDRIEAADKARREREELARAEGQRVEKELQAKIDEGTLSWTEKWRKQLAMAVPFLLVHIVWWTAMIRWNSWHKFTDRIAQQQRFRKVLPNGKSIRTMHSNVRPWYMSVTMIFGSMVAGATSESTSEADARAPEPARQSSPAQLGCGRRGAPTTPRSRGSVARWQSTRRRTGRTILRWPQL